MTPEETVSPYHAELINQIRELILINKANDCFQPNQPNLSKNEQGWKPIGNGPPYSDKITLINEKREVFAKVFAPETEDYAQRAAMALEELSLLSLRTPVLSPIAWGNNVLLFQLGQEVETEDYEFIFDKKSRIDIANVVRRYNLMPLGYFGHVETVVINEKTFVIDPFDDTTDGIFPDHEDEDDEI